MFHFPILPNLENVENIFHYILFARLQNFDKVESAQTIISKIKLPESTAR